MRGKAPKLYLHCRRQGRGIGNLCAWNRRGCGIIAPHWESPSRCRIGAHIIRIRWRVRVVRRVIRWRIGAVPIAPWVLLHRASKAQRSEDWNFLVKSDETRSRQEGEFRLYFQGLLQKQQQFVFCSFPAAQNSPYRCI